MVPAVFGAGCLCTACLGPLLGEIVLWVCSLEEDCEKMGEKEIERKLVWRKMAKSGADDSKGRKGNFFFLYYLGLLRKEEKAAQYDF